MSTDPTTAKVLNKRHGLADGVYIGRPTKWGNPFAIGKDGTRSEVIEKYRAWLRDQPTLVAALPELRGRNLICWCAPAPCHGDVLLELANPEWQPTVSTYYQLRKEG